MYQHHRAQHQRAQGEQKAGLLDKVLPALSVITMALTIPQVWTVWVDGKTSGVSPLSWGAYFVAACLWLVDGLRKHDKTIWVACIGWVVLDGAVLLGILVKH